MARRNLKPKATSEIVLDCIQKHCPECGKRMRNEYNNFRHIRTLQEVVQLKLKILRCTNVLCQRYKIAYRPERENCFALPQLEFGLDVLVLVGMLRYQKYRTVPQIYTDLKSRGLCISERNTTYLLAKYDNLISLWPNDIPRLREVIKKQERMILLACGIFLEFEPEIFWLIYESLSEEILAVRKTFNLDKLLLELDCILGISTDNVNVFFGTVISQNRITLADYDCMYGE
jgi:hypothetical protein